MRKHAGPEHGDEKYDTSRWHYYEARRRETDSRVLLTAAAVLFVALFWFPSWALFGSASVVLLAAAFIGGTAQESYRRADELKREGR